MDTYLYPVLGRDVITANLFRRINKKVQKIRKIVVDEEDDKLLLLVHKAKVVASAETFEEITEALKNHYDYDNCTIVVPFNFRDSRSDRDLRSKRRRLSE